MITSLAKSLLVLKIVKDRQTIVLIACHDVFDK